MKHTGILLLLLISITLIYACRHRHVTTMVISGNDDYLKIEYTGTIIFNDDSSGIMRISPDGYFKCKTNNDKLLVETDDKGHLIYEINGEPQDNRLNFKGRILLAQAIKEIIRQRG